MIRVLRYLLPAPALLFVLPLYVLARIAWFVVWRLLILAFRYVTGLPMFGEPSTDATFWSRGTQMVERPNVWGQRKATRWSLMPIWQRAVWRLGVPAVVLVAAYAVDHWPTATLTVAGWFVGAGAVVMVWRVVWRVRRHHHHHHYLRPLHEVLSLELGIEDDGLRPEHWLDIPVDFKDPDARFRVFLPRTFYAGAGQDEDDPMATRRGEGGAGGKRARVDGVVYEKLGLSASEMSVRYHTVGSQPVAEYHHISHAPTTVAVADASAAMVKAPESAPVIGLGRNGRVVSVDLDAESPHMLASMSAGGGKSVLMGGLVAQLLANGARTIILDFKRTSQKNLKDHPYVRYCRDIADIHDELVALAEECMRRAYVIDAGGDPGPRLVVLVEEQNALRDALDLHWDETGGRGKSPAVIALNKLLYMGREPKVHVLSVAQMGTANALGGPAARENYATRILGRATHQAWAMLAPQVPRNRIPRNTRKAGRVHVVVGGEVIETQAILWQRSDLREWAWRCFPEGESVTASQLSQHAFYLGEQGVKVTAEPVTEPVTEDKSANAQERESAKVQEHKNTVPEAAEAAAGRHLFVVPASGLPEVTEAAAARRSAPATPAEELAILDEPSPAVAEDDELVSFSEAVEYGVVSLSKVALRKAAARDRGKTFPEPVSRRGSAHLYRAEDLRFWERNRERGREKTNA